MHAFGSPVSGTPNDDLSVEIVDSVDGLQAHQGAWNDLLVRSEFPHPMCGYAWVRSLVDHLLDEGSTWLCLFVLEGNRLIGVLPVVGHESSRSLFRFDARSTPENGAAMSIGITAEVGREDEVVHALLGALCGAGPHATDRMHFRRHAPGATARALVVTRDDSRVRQGAGGSGCVFPVPTDFNEFRASLSRNFRGNLNKARRKLDALADVRFSFHQGADAREEHLEIFGDVEADGWKGERGTALLQSRRTAAFYRQAVRDLARIGWLEWHFLEAEGETIAAHLAIRCGRNLLIWKVGFRGRFAFCAPGNLLFEEMIRRRCASGDVDTIDVLTEYPWHGLWKMSRREYVDISLYRRRSFPASLSYQVDRADSALRRSWGVRLLKRMIGPPTR
jgi:CelD/BcsL family acetyltransferase involved in cellulose biosynthesis